MSEIEMTDENAADELNEANDVVSDSADVVDASAAEADSPEAAEVEAQEPAAEEAPAEEVVAEEAVAETTVEATEEVEEEEEELDEEAAAEAAEKAHAEARAKLTPEELAFSPDEIVTDEDLEEEDEDEDASPIEEFVEPVKEIKKDLDMEWYILKVQVNRENSVCDALKRQVKMAGMEGHFGDILVPTEDVREFNKAGKQRISKRKLYPGYIVVNMAIDDDSWFLVRDTSGIGDFAGAAGRPAPLSTEEINRIIATTRPEALEGDEDDSIKTAIPFKVGDRVRVKEGYFQNYEGDVNSVDERNGRIEVMINIFGRPNPVDMDHWHVEKV